MLRLILLRHAHTENSSPTGKDIDRRLSSKGQCQARELSVHFKEKTYASIRILCSAAKRTRQTFEALQGFNACSFQHELYLASREELLLHIGEQQNCPTLLVIGHNDGLSDLASYLTDSYIHLDTCTLLTLEVHLEEWQSLSGGTCTISEIFRPN